MRASMTLLQRGVIQRLREHGYSSLADATSDAWQHGERVTLGKIVHPDDAELRADFDKADAQLPSVED